MGESIIKMLAEDYALYSEHPKGETVELELECTARRINEKYGLSKLVICGEINDLITECLERGFYVGFKRAVNLILECKAAD